MNFDPTWRVSDLVMIGAVLLAPIFAVQASTFLDRRRERRGRKLAIFRTLMMTRAASTSRQHVEALNLIDVEFNGAHATEQGVREAWKAYVDQLGTPTLTPGWETRRTDLLIDLLQRMGKLLGYSFDKVHLKNVVYHPNAFVTADAELQELRQLAIRTLKGEVPLGVREAPPNTLGLVSTSDGSPIKPGI